MDNLWQWKPSFGDFPGGPAVKTLCFHCRGHGFHPWWSLVRELRSCILCCVAKKFWRRRKKETFFWSKVRNLPRWVQKIMERHSDQNLCFPGVQPSHHLGWSFPGLCWACVINGQEEVRTVSGKHKLRFVHPMLRGSDNKQLSSPPPTQMEEMWALANLERMNKACRQPGPRTRQTLCGR